MLVHDSEKIVSIGKEKSWYRLSYDQPFFSWIKASIFHKLVCGSYGKLTRWFWELRLYRMAGTENAPLCVWADLMCFDLDHAKRVNIRKDDIREDEYESAE